ncbi:response regulator [Sporosarcina sp. ANT_H38]|uniref:response regulator transcription factor n=1 Tax=Sporosarcina sp. ANT_H38 TaxID=2597358 RepID=UPI0011F1FD17|nr:response regulator [Sporosarcina sp. ANT_H38]KAA0965083.1 response regulator [Sporosarcina sp. ANT_H38]
MKVLIVDDEVIIREGMANVIPWSEYGFTLLKPASSAEEVIKRIDVEKPDILITDIQMKGKSGLELVSYISKHNYQIEIILLTGYDEFGYVQEAIRQDVCDYLLKTSSPDEILKAVQRARMRLDKLKRYSEWKESETEQFVTSEIRKILQNTNELFDFQQLIEILPALKEPPFQLLLIDKPIESEEMSSCEGIWNTYLNGKWFAYNEYTLVIIRRDPHLGDEYLLQMAIKKIGEAYNKPIFASEIVTSLSKMPYLYSQVSSLLLYQWILTEQLVIKVEDVETRSGIPYKVSISEHEESLINCMKEEGMEEWISNLVDWLFSHPQATPESIQFYVQSLYIETIRYINRMSSKKGKESINYPSIPSADKWFVSPKEILLSLFSMLLNDFKLDYKKNPSYVDDSIMYIEKHLGKSISLKEVAEQVHIHPNYLSEMIRKETGISYMDLLTDLRVKKAADYLLHTTAKVKEIANLVGYNDSKYFTSIFKKHYEVTPTQFREQNFR